MPMRDKAILRDELILCVRQIYDKLTPQTILMLRKWWNSLPCFALFAPNGGLEDNVSFQTADVQFPC